MVLILSEENDFSTNSVLDYFIYNDKAVKRYNGPSKNEGNISLNLNNFFFKIELGQTESITLLGKKEKTEINVSNVWFRRPFGGVSDFNISLNTYDNLINKNSIHKSILDNYKIFKDYLFDNITRKPLGSYTITGLNKLKTLGLAREVGLKIPDTIITNNYDDVVQFFLKSKNGLISKAIHEAYADKSNIGEDFWISNKTISINSLGEIPNSFGPSIFQENIQKKYEIRVFFLDGDFYSSCIFSQSNEKTKVDFRNYDQKRPNRITPYKLPEKVENKIKKLMSILDLNTGSIDLIKNKKNQYVFLEINPVGQFGFVSRSCNFNIDSEIYNYLNNE
ncbi:grasp-with-spasm system ATP-grasp peptide maturase [Tenacibaculum mesophilum]|uniref:grasp-with-spasm system ATP-grasp peptide maturase n=1 Tax=Tenacibaculum mesophilum TaxID=104268 RepID=UPI00248F8828|nr:grasp-with-spasm system ATP-grasp peptide maturase [Tenacibaculum mesophilum]